MNADIGVDNLAALHIYPLHPFYPCKPDFDVGFLLICFNKQTTHACSAEELQWKNC